MTVSGKKVILIMFAIAIGLCLWVRAMAPKLTVKDVPSVLPAATDKPKLKRGYRTKMFPTMEEARSIAEKKLKETLSMNMIITKYRAYADGYIFDYENEKYLNTGKPGDRGVNQPIFVHKDGSTEFFTGEQKKPVRR